MDRVLRLAFVLAAAILAGPSPAKADVDYSSHDLGENAVTVGDRAYRLFRLPLAAPADLAVTVHSTDFDPVLFLIPPDGRPLFNDDARDLDAALAVPRAAAGDWYLAVGSFAPAIGGAFTLALSPAEAAGALADASDSAELARLTPLLDPPGRPTTTSAARAPVDAGEHADYRGMIVVGSATGATPTRPGPPGEPPPVPTLVPAGPATTAAAPTELPPLLPWPPPEPSARMQVARSLFLGGDPAASLGDVDDRLRAALSANGYAEVGYFGVPEGFAVVTRLERFEPGGISAAGPSRWSLEMPPLATFDLFAYVRALLAAETGHFRVIAFVATSAPFAAGEAGIDTETLERWSRAGTNALPVAVRAWPFGEGHAVTALVYEFSRVRGGRSVKLNLPSETSAQEHLTASHILASLEGR